MEDWGFCLYSNMKRVPFDLELAWKVQLGEVKGCISTNHDVPVALVKAKYGIGEEYSIPVIWHPGEDGMLVMYNEKGECKNSHEDCYLHIELDESKEEKPKTNDDYERQHDMMLKYVYEFYGDPCRRLHSNELKKFATKITVNGFVIKDRHGEDDLGRMPKIIFSPFDKVIVVNRPTLYKRVYHADMLSHYTRIDGTIYACTTRGDILMPEDLIPFEGNEHLLINLDN